MYKKQITDLALIGLKHFFNLDAYVVTQFFLLVLLFLVTWKENIAEIARQIALDLQQLKEDLQERNISSLLQLHLARK